MASERAFYGDTHPYAHPSEGYESSVETVLLGDVKAFYRTHVRPDNAILLVAGNLPAEDLRARLESRLGRWAAEGPLKTQRVKAPPPAGSPRLIVVDKPDAPQTEIRILVPSPAISSPLVPYLTLQNLIFGGTFTSRLVANLREKNHFTYRASSAFTLRSEPGHLVASSAVHTEKTGAALVEFCKEFRRMKEEEPAAEELEKAFSTYATRIIEALQTQSGTLQVYAGSAAMGFPPGERREFHGKVLAARDPGLSRQSLDIFEWDRATFVLVGDRKAIEEQVKELRGRLPGRPEGGMPCELPEIEVADRDGAVEPADETKK